MKRLPARPHRWLPIAPLRGLVFALGAVVVVASPSHAACTPTETLGCTPFWIGTCGEYCAAATLTEQTREACSFCLRNTSTAGLRCECILDQDRDRPGQGAGIRGYVDCDQCRAAGRSGQGVQTCRRYKGAQLINSFNRPCNIGKDTR